MTRTLILLFVLANLGKISSQLEDYKANNSKHNASLERETIESNRHETEFENVGKKRNFSKKWITQLFAEAKWKFDMPAGVSDECAADFKFYKDHLIHNQTIWAVRMHEASEWPVVGILAGITEHLGHWLECVKIKRPEFSGKYCLVQSKLTFSVNEDACAPSKISNQISSECSAWSFLEMCNHNPNRVIRSKISWAICMPSSCTANDLEKSLVRTLHPIFEKNLVNITVNVNPLLCQVKESNLRHSPWYTYTKLLLYFLFAMVIIATIYDYISSERANRNAGSLMNLFTSFSVVRTYNSIIEHDPSTTLTSLYLLKIIAVISVLFGHRWMFTISFPFFQIEDLELEMSVFRLKFTNIVDLFFMISGFLMYYHTINPLKVIGSLYIVFQILLRYIRMIPPYGIILLFGVNILPSMGDGPLWAPYMKKMFGPCQSNWWQNILGINNLQAASNKCYLPTWYLAVDLQLSFLGGMILWLLSKNEKLGKITMALTFAASSIIASIVAHYSLKFSGFFVFTARLIKDLRNERTLYYSATYPRISPYLFGFVTGMVVVKLKQKKFLFSQFQAIVMLSSSILMALAVLDYGTETESPNHIPSIIDLIFTVIYRSIIVLPFAIFICISTTGISNLGILKPVFSITEWKGFIALGRLTYCQFLVGPMFQLYHVYSQRNSIRSSNLFLDLILWTFTDYVLTLALAFVLYLISYGPATVFLPVIKEKIKSLIIEKPEKEDVKEKKID